MKRLFTVAGMLLAVTAGIFGGLVLALFSDPFQAFSFNQVSVISWRGGGDAIPASATVSGWSAPMFYTTPDEGADPSPPAGRFPTGVWAPGDVVERSLVVSNVDPVYMLKLRQIQTQMTGNLKLAPWLVLTVTDGDGNRLYQGSLDEFTEGAFMDLSQTVILPRNGTQTLRFAVGLDRDVSQSLQGQAIKADFSIVAEQYALPMTIDIKPNSWPNGLNGRSSGGTPVAINGSAGINVTKLDDSSARFGPNQVPPLKKAGFEDWNHDGYLDMVLQFDTTASGIACGTTSATLTIASLDGGTVYEGTDAVKVPGCK